MKKALIIGAVLLIITGLAYLSHLNCLKDEKIQFKSLIQQGDVLGVNSFLNKHPDNIRLDLGGHYKDKLEPLALAASANQYGVCSTLIARGANVNAIDKYRLTPLHQAVSTENTNIVLLLLKNGADTSIKDIQGRTPLDIAKEMKLDDLIRLLSPPQKLQ